MLGHYRGKNRNPSLNISFGTFPGGKIRIVIIEADSVDQLNMNSVNFSDCQAAVSCSGAHLTRPLGAQQILALRLVWVDGGDGHIIGRVRVQALQDVGGLVVVQNGLMEKTQTRIVSEGF